MRGAGEHGAFTRRVLAWGRARGATWIVHGHEHAPLLLRRDGVTLVRPGATLGGRLRYALLDLASGEASLHAERL
jgi:predicted phosphodiesterase